jgi:molybdenum cofactor guanylyltransferase
MQQQKIDARDNEIDAAAIVLAGGKSSRMGTPKALLRFDDQPLIAHIVSTLGRVFPDIIVVAAPGEDMPPPGLPLRLPLPGNVPVTLVRDEVAFQGPAAGLYNGLSALRSHDVAFVTACDSAFLNLALVSHLVSLIPDHDVVVPHWQGRLQPLHSVYRRSVAPLLAEQIARRELRLAQLFDRVRTRRVDEEEIRRFDPNGDSFFNMNKPADYEEALRRFSNKTAAAGL